MANCRVGDPHKMILLDAAVKVMKRDKLVEMQNETGKVMLDGLKDLEARFPGVLHASRGLGTFIAVDAPTEAKRDALVVSFQ